MSLPHSSWWSGAIPEPAQSQLSSESCYSDLHSPLSAGSELTKTATQKKMDKPESQGLCHPPAPPAGSPVLPWYPGSRNTILQPPTTHSFCTMDSSQVPTMQAFQAEHPLSKNYLEVKSTKVLPALKGPQILKHTFGLRSIQPELPSLCHKPGLEIGQPVLRGCPPVAECQENCESHGPF